MVTEVVPAKNFVEKEESAVDEVGDQHRVNSLILAAMVATVA